MNEDKLNELIAQAKSLSELGEAMLKATKDLKNPATENTFTKEELDAVLKEVEELKVALTALVPTV